MVLDVVLFDKVGDFGGVGVGVLFVDDGFALVFFGVIANCCLLGVSDVNVYVLEGGQRDC